ncbi:MAG: right-handed parallel beta-helix repeat-containing protein [Phycisphaerales bacterium]|nr:right-handed parallel beta-helix repeat-containing protein [Phycisphaerales bacterium]
MAVRRIGQRVTFLWCFVWVSGASAQTASNAASLRPEVLPYENESDLIIAQDSHGAYLRNGDTGTIILGPGPPVDEIFERAFLHLDDAGGGRVHVKSGTYTFVNPAVLGGKSHISIVGDHGTVLTGPDNTGAVFQVVNGSTDVTIADLRFAHCAGKGINVQDASDVRITGCVFEEIGEDAVQIAIPQDGVYVERLWITGCRFRGGEAESDSAAVHAYEVRDLFVLNNVIESWGRGGFNIQKSSGRVVIADNTIGLTGFVEGACEDQIVEGYCGVAPSNGIYVGSGTASVTVRGNHVHDCGGIGIEASSGVGLGSQFVICDNVFLRNGLVGGGASGTNHGGGIYITGSHHTVTNNICAENGGTGIQLGYGEDAQHILVHGNVIADNAQYESGAGISMNAPSEGNGFSHVQDVAIRDNLITNEAGTQDYGIRCSATTRADGNLYWADGVLIEGNRISGHGVQQIWWPVEAEQIIVRGNVGFASASRGDATIAAGDQFVIVAHGLDFDLVGVAPDPTQVQVTPTSELDSGVCWWVSDVTDTSFTINTSDVAPTGGSTFNWVCVER